MCAEREHYRAEDALGIQRRGGVVEEVPVASSSSCVMASRPLLDCLEGEG